MISFARPTLVACRRSVFRLPQSRLFITLPDLSSLSPFPSNEEPPKTQTYQERRILPGTQKELYDVVADVRSYPQFLPFCTSARIISSISEPTSNPDISMKRMEAELSVGFMSFTESYTSEVTCIPYESVQAIASSSTPLFKTLNTTWKFQPVQTNKTPDFTTPLAASKEPEASQTLVTLDLTYAFANPVYAVVSAQFFDRVSKMMVEAFEKRCLDKYGSRRY